MCSRIEDIEEDNTYLFNILKPKLSSNCKKCNGKGTVILRKKDVYCDICFVSNTCHKFRASLGKTKMLKPNHNILLSLSGGLGSMTLLDLVHSGMALDTHKKLRVIPHCLHIMDCLSLGATSQKLLETAKKIIDICGKYAVDVYIVHMSSYIQKDIKLPSPNQLPDPEDMNQYIHELGNNVTPTGKNDLIAKMKRDLFIRVAEKLNCNIVFTAETTTTLAANMLSNLAIGRGSQIEHDVSFCDSRDVTVKILRPLKDISAEELKYYSNIKKITQICHTNVHQDSLQSVIKTFVTDLQENYQATISTVCKTAEKLGVNNQQEINQMCIICQSTLDTQRGKSSALQATNFSRMVSSVHPSNFEMVASAHGENSTAEGSSQNLSYISNVHKNLCYGCRLTFSEIKDYDCEKIFSIKG